VGIKEKNLGRSFTARAYVSALFATGQIFTVYGDAMTATAKSLASDALEAHASGSSDYSEKLSLLESYAAAPDFAVKDPIRIMSYNVYYTDVNSERADSVLDMIEKHSPDVMGLQEVTLEVWKPILMDRLGDRYAYVGHGRENGGIGEGTPIIYRKDKFTLLDSGTRWLSDTPTVWSKYEGSRQSRIFTYAILKRNSDGQVFSFINTHLDTVSESVRVRQLGSLARQIPELGLNEHPMILTGDMNAFASAGGEIPLILGLGFKDTMHLTVQPTTSTTTEVIDFCFVRADCTVLSHQRDGEKSYNGASPSDHLPIVADMRLH
jgi:endonuclease/exonuclease/phosphatase family metal-dependent hydrolase